MEDAINDLFEILVIMNVNVINWCDVGEYLDHENCKCRKRLLDKLVEECSKNIDENNVIYNGTLNDYGKICNSCTVYIVLLVTFFIISILAY